MHKSCKEMDPVDEQPAKQGLPEVPPTSTTPTHFTAISEFTTFTNHEYTRRRGTTAWRVVSPCLPQLQYPRRESERAVLLLLVWTTPRIMVSTHHLAWSLALVLSDEDREAAYIHDHNAACIERFSQFFRRYDASGKCVDRPREMVRKPVECAEPWKEDFDGAWEVWRFGSRDAVVVHDVLHEEEAGREMADGKAGGDRLWCLGVLEALLGRGVVESERVQMAKKWMFVGGLREGGLAAT